MTGGPLFAHSTGYFALLPELERSCARLRGCIAGCLPTHRTEVLLVIGELSVSVEFHTEKTGAPASKIDVEGDRQSLAEACFFPHGKR